jgi:GNAT superfamily N-acetyltransferase
MLSVRHATREDVPILLRFIRELATYEREPHSVVATEEDLLRDGFGERPFFHALIAEWTGEPAGFAFYFFQYSTWTGGPVLYLEDLFVTPSHRKRGIGKELMRRLAEEAVRANCKRFQWAVLDWNKPAIRFYESLGARVLGDWRTVRADGDTLRALARRSAQG